MVQKAKTIKNASKNSRKKSKKPLVIALIIILAVAVISTIALLIYFNWPKEEQKSDDNTTSSSTEKSEDSAKKEEDNKSETAENKTPESLARAEEGKNNSQYEGADPNTLDALTGVINYAGVSGGFVSVRAMIDQYITGSCAFTMTSPSGKTVTSTENTAAGPAATYCSVDFYAQQFTESGTWKITVKVEGDNKTGTITGEVNL